MARSGVLQPWPLPRSRDLDPTAGTRSPQQGPAPRCMSSAPQPGPAPRRRVSGPVARISLLATGSRQLHPRSSASKPGLSNRSQGLALRSRVFCAVAGSRAYIPGLVRCSQVLRPTAESCAPQPGLASCCMVSRPADGSLTPKPRVRAPLPRLRAPMPRLCASQLGLAPCSPGLVPHSRVSQLAAWSHTSQQRARSLQRRSLAP